MIELPFALDARLITYIVWGLGTTLLYTIVVIRRWKDWRKRPDRRARRELLEVIGLWITAAAANLSVLSIFGIGERGIAVAVALGSFSAVGLIMVTDRRRDHA